MSFRHRVIGRLALLFLVSTALPAVGDPVVPPPPPMPMPMSSASPLAMQRIAVQAAFLAGLPRSSVTVKERDGLATYGGVALGAVLARAGIPQGKDLRGPMLGQVAVVVASDGYRVAFAFPELDPAFTDRIVLLADMKNGQPLDAKSGPFRVIVPDEKREARWIHSVTEIDIETPA